MLGDWLKNEYNRWEFAGRTVRVADASTRSAVIEFIPGTGTRGRQAWVCRLIREDEGGWKINVLEGGPFRKAGL